MISRSLNSNYGFRSLCEEAVEDTGVVLKISRYHLAIIYCLRHRAAITAVAGSRYSDDNQIS